MRVRRPARGEGRGMTDHKDLARRFFKEVFDNGNLDAIDDLLVKDAVDHEKPPPGLTMKPGRGGVTQLCKAYVDAFKPMTTQIHDIYQDGDTVITRTTYTGTHSG